MADDTTPPPAEPVAPATPVVESAAVATENTPATNKPDTNEKVTEIASNAVGSVVDLGGNITGLSGVASHVEQGNTVGTTIAATSAITNNAGNAVSVAAAVGKEGLDDVGAGLGKANILVSVADGVYQISQEDSVEHAAQRTAAVAANIGTGLGVGAVLTGGLTTAGGVAATGAAAVGTAVAAPIVVGAAATMVVGTAADTMIDTSRTYEDMQEFKPSERFTSMIGMQTVLAGRMEELGAERGANGKFDMGDPKTAELFGQALSERKAELDGLVESTKPALPRWVQFTEAQRELRGEHEVAKMDAQLAAAASEELPRYMAELKSFHEGQQTASMDNAKAQALAALSPSFRQSISMESKIDALQQTESREMIATAAPALGQGIRFEETSLSDVNMQSSPATSVTQDRGAGHGVA